MVKPKRKAGSGLVRNHYGSLEGALSLSQLAWSSKWLLLFSYLHNDNMVTNGFFMGVLSQKNIKCPKIQIKWCKKNMLVRHSQMHS